MKKQTVSFFLLLFAGNILFFSCGNMRNKSEATLKFDSIQVNRTAHLFQDTAKPTCNIVINFSYISETPDSVLKDSLNAYFLSTCFGQKYATGLPREAVKNYTQTYVNEYRSDLEPMYTKEKETWKDDGMNTDAWYSYYKTIESHVQLCTDQLLVYRSHMEEYTGGAHGIYMTYFANFDLRTHKLLQIEDIFVEDYREKLTGLLWKKLMADNKVASRQEAEELGYGTTGELEPTNNFYLSRKGITFYYNIYEIAPYAMGAIEICLPWNMLKEIKNDQFDLTL